MEVQWLQTSNYDGPFDGQRELTTRDRAEKNYGRTTIRRRGGSIRRAAEQQHRRRETHEAARLLGRVMALVESHAWRPAMLRSHIPIAETRRQPETGQDKRLQRTDSQTDVGQRDEAQGCTRKDSLTAFTERKKKKRKKKRKRNETKFASLYYVRLLLDGSPRRLCPALSVYVLPLLSVGQMLDRLYNYLLKLAWAPFSVLDKRCARDKFHLRC